MKSATDTIDIASSAEIAELAHRTQRTGRRQVLVENGIAIAVVSKPRSERNRPRVSTDTELREVLNATRGAWRSNVDPGEFKRLRRELQEDDREPRIL